MSDLNATVFGDTLKTLDMRTWMIMRYLEVQVQNEARDPMASVNWQHLAKEYYMAQNMPVSPAVTETEHPADAVMFGGG